MGNSNVFKRNAGILMAISSLPSPYGIGTLGKDAYEFVDFVRDSNHKYWQVLPVGPTTYGASFLHCRQIAFYCTLCHRQCFRHFFSCD